MKRLIVAAMALAAMAFVNAQSITPRPSADVVKRACGNFRLRCSRA